MRVNVNIRQRISSPNCRDEMPGTGDPSRLCDHLYVASSNNSAVRRPGVQLRCICFTVRATPAQTCWRSSARAQNRAAHPTRFRSAWMSAAPDTPTTKTYRPVICDACHPHTLSDARSVPVVVPASSRAHSVWNHVGRHSRISNSRTEWHPLECGGTDLRLSSTSAPPRRQVSTSRGHSRTTGRPSLDASRRHCTDVLMNCGNRGIDTTKSITSRNSTITRRAHWVTEHQRNMDIPSSTSCHMVLLVAAHRRARRETECNRLPPIRVTYGLAEHLDVVQPVAIGHHLLHQGRTRLTFTR